MFGGQLIHKEVHLGLAHLRFGAVGCLVGCYCRGLDGFWIRRERFCCARGVSWFWGVALREFIYIMGGGGGGNKHKNQNRIACMLVCCFVKLG